MIVLGDLDDGLLAMNACTFLVNYLYNNLTLFGSWSLPSAVLASFSLSDRRATPHARSSVSANGRVGRYSECGQVRTWAHSE